MKQIPTHRLGLILFCMSFLFFASSVKAQNYTITAKSNVSVSDNCNGYYEFLPQGYNPNKKYPVLIVFHGVGEDGDGSSGQLKNLTNTALPALIVRNGLPASFTVNGNTYQLIIIAPQFTTNPTSDIDGVYNYVITHYPVDINRVYLSGYSQGGGNSFEYTGTLLATSQKIAAIVPICATVTVSPVWAQHLASSNVPILATHNMGDGTWSYLSTINNVNLINAQTPPPTPLARDTIFAGGDHDAWDHTYDPLQFTYNGLSIYQWMLQFSRNLGSSALPVTLGAYTVQLTAPSAVTVNWTTLTEINNRNFTIERSADGSSFNIIGTVPATNDPNGHAYTYVDNHPLNGNSYYRLSQTDLDGKQTYFKVQEVTVAPTIASGLRISPNPVSSYIQLELVHPETGDLHVTLSDMQGRILQTWKFTKQDALWQQSLQIGNLPAGNYTIQIKGTTIREVQQFMKQ